MTFRPSCIVVTIDSAIAKNGSLRAAIFVLLVLKNLPTLHKVVHFTHGKFGAVAREQSYQSALRVDHASLLKGDC